MYKDVDTFNFIISKKKNSKKFGERLSMPSAL